MLEQLFADLADPFPALAWNTALMRLVAATLLGGMIGLERQVHRKPAGLRTHMMISLAACLFTLLAYELMEIRSGQDEHLRIDPLRLVEAVTAGVAFLAAGTIISSQEKVRGLTTGAGMWMAGAIGLACGLGQLVLAAMAVAVALVVLWLLRIFEK